jgi:hypothetical protein
MSDELRFLEFPDEGWYVWRHVSQVEGEAAADEAWEEYHCGDEPPEWGPVEHVWGRWEAFEEYEDVVTTYTWYTRRTEDPRYFPVTLIPRAAWVAERAELDRIRQEAREWCSERFPPDQIGTVYAADREGTSVDLRIRGLFGWSRVRVWPWCDGGTVQIGHRAPIPWQDFADMMPKAVAASEWCFKHLAGCDTHDVHVSSPEQTYVDVMYFGGSDRARVWPWRDGGIVTVNSNPFGYWPSRVMPWRVFDRLLSELEP